MKMKWTIFECCTNKPKFLGTWAPPVFLNHSVFLSISSVLLAACCGTIFCTTVFDMGPWADPEVPWPQLKSNWPLKCLCPVLSLLVTCQREESIPIKNVQCSADSGCHMFHSQHTWLAKILNTKVASCGPYQRGDAKRCGWFDWPVSNGKREGTH